MRRLQSSSVCRCGAAARLLSARARSALRRAERLADGLLASSGPRRSRIRRRQQDDLADVRGRAPNLVPYVGPFDGFHAIPASPGRRRTASCASTTQVLGRGQRRRASRRTSRLFRSHRAQGRTGGSSGTTAVRFGVAKPSAIPGTRCRWWSTSRARSAAARRFQSWVLPAGIERMRRKLKVARDGDRPMVRSSAPCSPMACRRSREPAPRR